MTTALVTLTNKLAATLDMGDGTDLIQTLKATAFKGQVSDAQMTALMVVANQYGLNPWTKEIYAFPDKNNGIVPVVGVDGWARIINNHPQFDGMEFEQDADSCTCIMYRKDRGRPVKVTEYMIECKRAGVGPWSSHPYRMLRHKAMIQCARLAFGYGGIYDPDEAERIAESPRNMGMVEVVQTCMASQETLEAANNAAKKGVSAYSAFWKQSAPDVRKAIGKDKHEELKQIAMDAEKNHHKSFDEVMKMLSEAKDIDSLYAAGDCVGYISDVEDQRIASVKFDEIRSLFEAT